MAKYGSSKYGAGKYGTETACVEPAFCLNDVDLIPLYCKPDNTAPMGLSARQNDPTSIHLSWLAPVDTSLVSGYGVYYSFTDTFAYNKIGETSSLEYIVTGLEHGREYLFAVNSILYDSPTYQDTSFYFGFGMFSETTMGTSIVFESGQVIPLDPNFIPKNPKASGVNDSSIMLSWDPPVSGTMSGYRIWRSSKYSSEMTPIGSTKDTWYIDSGLDVTSHYYRVTSLY